MWRCRGRVTQLDALRHSMLGCAHTALAGGDQQRKRPHMSETKTLYLDLVPTAQENITGAVERLENIGLAAAGAARHAVDPYIEAVRSTRRYLSVDHTQVLDATVGYVAKLAEQQRGFLAELGDVILGKPGAQRPAKPRSSAAA